MFHDKAYYPQGQVISRNATFAEVAKPLHRASVGRWKSYQEFFEPHPPKLAPLLRGFGYE